MEDDTSAAPAPAGSACLVGHVTVKDPAKWAEYCSKVPATVTPWGGQLLFRGKRNSVLSGAHAHTDVVAIRFPDAATLRAWHDSPAYQALIPIREQAVDLVLVSYDC